MKAISFFTYTLIFCCAWAVLVLLSWGGAQSMTQTIVMPWVLQVINVWPAAVAFTIGGAMAILGAFLAAAVLLVVLLALEAGLRRLQQFSASLPS